MLRNSSLRFSRSLWSAVQPTSKHQTRISSSGLTQKKPQDSTYQRELTEAARSSQPEYHQFLVCFSLWSHDKWRSVKKVRGTNARVSSAKTSINEAQWRQQSCQANQCKKHRPLSAGLYLYSFQMSHVLSRNRSRKTAHAFSPGSFQRNTMCLFSGEHPLIRQFPEKHYMTQLSLQPEISASGTCRDTADLWTLSTKLGISVGLRKRQKVKVVRAQ